MRKKSTIWMLPLLVVMVAALVFPMASAVAAGNPTTVTLTLPSGVTGPNGELTQTAGFTRVDPVTTVQNFVSDTGTEVAGPFFGPYNAYSDLPVVSTWNNASIISSKPGSWTSISGANWISTTSNNSGADIATEGEAWRIFKASFNVPTGVSLTSAAIQIAGDNAYEVYLNDSLVTTTENFTPSAPVYGTAPLNGPTNPFTSVHSYNIDPIVGNNTLVFVLRNWNNKGNANPTGLIYKITISSYINANPLNPASYSNNGNWYTAPVVDKHPTWTALDGAKWVSTTSVNYGVEVANEGDTWRLYKENFNIPACVSDLTGSIQIAADNAFEVYLNGHLIGTSGTFNPAAPVYGLWPGSGSQTPFKEITTYIFTPQTGANTLMFVVRNWNNNGANPSGLLYKAVVQYNQSPRPANVWWLNSINHNSISDTLEMEKIQDIQTGSVALIAEEPVTWLSDEAAQANVTFAAGDWTLSLHTAEDWGEKWEAEVGQWNTLTNEFSPFTGVKSATWDATSSRLTIILNGSGVTIDEGNYIALRITNFPGGTIITDYEQCGSYLAPPESSPGYPVPELPAGMLLALGLTAIAAFLVINRKKVVKANIEA